MEQQAIEGTRCPLCGKDNKCGNVAGLPHGACWCSQKKFPPHLLERIPNEQRNRSCICESCLKEAQLGP